MLSNTRNVILWLLYHSPFMMSCWQDIGLGIPQIPVTSSVGSYFIRGIPFRRECEGHQRALSSELLRMFLSWTEGRRARLLLTMLEYLAIMLLYVCMDDNIPFSKNTFITFKVKQWLFNIWTTNQYSKQSCFIELFLCPICQSKFFSNCTIL